LVLDLGVNVDADIDIAIDIAIFVNGCSKECISIFPAYNYQSIRIPIAVPNYQPCVRIIVHQRGEGKCGSCLTSPFPSKLLT
jgi:hypothetical protein